MTQKLKIFTALLLLSISSCKLNDKSKTNEEYRKFSEFEIVNTNQISWNNLLSQKEERYLVFVYSETCDHCHVIQEEVISFAEDGIIQTYFIDTKISGDVTLTKDISDTIGATKIKDVAILGTPTLFEIEDAAVKANIPGQDSILSFLNEARFSN